MEENRNKQNTLLLTVIAIATLLVAVIGATFAYFTANIGVTQTSTITVNGATLTIAYAGGTNELTARSGLEPQVASLGEKQFTLQAVNTTDLRMPYTLYLAVSNNEFVLDNATTGTSLSYKITASTSTAASDGNIPTSTAYGAIPTSLTVTGNTYTMGGNTITYTHNSDNNYDHLSTRTLSSYTVDTGNGAAGTSINGVKLGVGYFKPTGTTTATTVTHSYTIELFFLEDNKNQDEDKNKSFAGYIVVSAGDQAIASNSPATNCADSAC